MINKQTADKILSRAMSLKVDGADVYLRSSASTTIEVKEQKVDAFDRARDIGAGLRVVEGGRLGFASTTDLSDGAIQKLAQDAVTNARNADPDKFNGLPGKSATGYAEVNIFDRLLEGLAEEEMIARVMAMEKEAYAVDPRVKRIRKASARFSSAETLLMSSSGIELSFRGTIGYSSIEVVAEEKGESQAGWDSDIKRFYDKLEIEEVARRAAKKALNLLGARSIPSVKAPVILDRTVAEELLSIMASGFSAENVQKKKSLFMDKLNQVVMSPLVTIYDDGLLAGGVGAAPADDEGVPTSRKTVVDKGRLLLFLHNTYTANKEGTVSTGNAVRGGFKGLPGVGVTNLSLSPGAQSPQEAIAGTEKGFYVTEIMGAHTANSISGDFSVGATGFWIEKGKIAYPVREATIAGNLLDVMKNVDAVCSDLKFSGRIGSPTIRIKELSIAGK